MKTERPFPNNEDRAFKLLYPLCLATLLPTEGGIDRVSRGRGKLNTFLCFEDENDF
jgi:hypothetical protein